MKTVVLLVFLATANIAFGQSLEIDLVTKFKTQAIKVVNREISLGADGQSLQMNAVSGDGLGIIEDVSFSEGVVELDIRGKNAPGRSFVGFAFNIQNDSTYEAIYFRPFNFIAQEEIRRAHMLQYIHHPQYTWRVLRETRTGQFENRIENPPNPDDWFHARIVIESDRVVVYVDGADEPSLQVERLSSQQSDIIGLWTGFNSAGSFRNLKLSEQE